MLHGRFAAVLEETAGRFVTVDVTWIHHYTPVTKEQSKQWVTKGESAPKEVKTGPSAEKIMATVFWDSQGIILIDYLKKGKTISGAYYSSLLDLLETELQEKRTRLAHKKSFSITTTHQLTPQQLWSQN